MGSDVRCALHSAVSEPLKCGRLDRLHLSVIFFLADEYFEAFFVCLNFNFLSAQLSREKELGDAASSIRVPDLSETGQQQLKLSSNGKKVFISRNSKEIDDQLLRGSHNTSPPFSLLVW